MCTNVRVLGIGSFVIYFLNIVGIVGFCDFVLFSSHHNTLIL